MKNSVLKNIKDSRFIVIYFVFFISISIYLIYLAVAGDETRYKADTPRYFVNKWKYEYEDGKIGLTNTPNRIELSESKYLRLTNYLPRLQKGTYIIYKAKNTFTRITVGDKVVYDNLTEEEEKNEWCTLKGIDYIDIEVEPDDSYKMITIESYTSVSNYLADIGDVFLIDKGSFIISVIRDGYMTVACLVVFLTVAVVLGAAWLVIVAFYRQNIRELLYLCMFTLTVSLWLATESSVIRYICHGSTALIVMAFEMLILMPVPMVLFCKQMSIRKHTLISYKVGLIVPLMLFLVNNLLHFLHLVPLPGTLRLTQLVLGLEIIYVGYFQISEYIYLRKHGDKNDSNLRILPLFGIIVMVPMSILEISKYTFLSNTGSNNGVFISIGLAIYVCSLAMDTVSQNALKSIKFQEAAQTKTQFLANMSHEIRTPLNAVLGFNEAILQANKDEKIRKYALNIQQAGDNLKGIINSILDISKIEAGKLEIYSMEYNMLHLLDSLTSMMTELAQKKGLTIYTEIDSNIPEELIGDEQHLRQILTNIMNNAVKYTEKGSVTLTAKLIEMKKDSATCKILFSVKDTGTGIKDADQVKLFEKFERIGADKNTSIEGTGLGMSIVLQTLQAMGSEIKLKSKYGEGSDFYFELEQCVISDKTIGNFEERRKEEASNSAHRGNFCAPDAKILVVDDVEMNLEAITAILEFTQIQIDTALSGKIAIEKVKNNQYDIIFMDHMMPEMDGIETTTNIRNLAVETNEVYYAVVPIIALTANAMVGMKEQFQQSGMQDFVSKPIEISTILKALLTWLPKEKIVKADKTIISVDSDDIEKTTDTPTDEWNIDISEIELDEAKKYNANFNGFVKNLNLFYKAYADNKDEIRKYAGDGDIKNYVIKVHGLKSTSKMIGAMKLSNKALELETNGNDGQLSLEETDVLFDLYDKVIASIALYLGIDNESSDDASDAISIEEYDKLIERIKKAATSFDAMEFMTLDEEMGNLKVPADKEEEFKKLSTMVTNMAFGDVNTYFG